MKYYLLITLIFISHTTHSSELDTVNKLQTLFTSPDLRIQLNALRDAGKYTHQQSDSSTSIFKKPARIKIKGVVLRDNKTPVVFINNSNTIQSNQLDNNTFIYPEGTHGKKYTVPIIINNKTISVRPGQTWDETTNKAQENYIPDSTNELSNMINGTLDKITNDIN